MSVTLNDLRRWVGAVSTADDDLLTQALDASQAWIADRIYADRIDEPDIDQATLILASRLYKRKNSPEGTAGFGQEGFVVSIRPNDPDIRALLERHLDMTRPVDADGVVQRGGVGLG